MFADQFLTVCDSATVDGAIGGAALVVDLVKRERLGVGCNGNNAQIPEIIPVVFTQNKRLDIIPPRNPPSSNSQGGKCFLLLELFSLPV